MIGRALLLAQLTVVAIAAHEWAYATTWRLYLERRADVNAKATAVQRFEIERGRVVPQIVTRGPDRIGFDTHTRGDAHVRVQVRPAGTASYEIIWRGAGAPRTLAQGTASSPTDIDGAYPTGRGIIELVADAPVVWADPRVAGGFAGGRYAAALLALIACAWFARRHVSTRPGPFALRAATVGLASVCALLASEAALRALGDRVPAGIATERHNLGEVTRDPQWIESPRYGRRLRPNVDTLNEWRFGDVVTRGYMPAAASVGTLHQFRFRTDAEGFRNARVRDRIEIAALGDSFTDAMTLPEEDSWPSHLERLLGVPVQNYGTAGFGPQQELLVLKDYVARHRPRRVVLAYFAGNDLFDAEAFDDFQRSGGTMHRTPPGWRIKEVVSRFDTWFLVSALHSVSRRADGEPSMPPRAADDRPVATAGEQAIARFDRGMFDVPVNGTHLRFAFMPPYLNTLTFDAADLRARRGWALTAEAIREMRDVSRSFGAAFVVMFVPFKSQVYLDVVDRAFARDELGRAFDFYLNQYGQPVDISRMRANRYAQNDLMRELCARERIPLLDTTPALEMRVRAGENMYFPDESHLNEAGEAVLAGTLAAFLPAVPEVAGPR